MSKFTKINIANATYVSQGPDHTLFKLGKQVVGCGSNEAYQMGPNKGTFVQPTLLFQNEDLMSTAACEYGSIFVIKNNLYVIGREMYGELGSPKDVNIEMTLVNLPNADKINRAVCREEFSILYYRVKPDESDGLSGGQIAAIVIGSIAGVVVLGLVGFFTYKVVKEKRKYEHLVTGTVAEPLPEEF